MSTVPGSPRARPGLLPLACAAALLLGCSSDRPAAITAEPATITIVGPSPWHVHPPGAPFTVQVTVGGSGVVVVRWVDSRGRLLAAPTAIPCGEPVDLTSPAGEIGYYGLVFTSPGGEIAFPPQSPGFPSAEHGFAILEPADPARAHDPDSPFGSIHCRREVDGKWDPYLRGHHAKTMSWHSSSARWWKYELDIRAENGLSELPLVNGKLWETDNDVPITDADLDAMAEQFQALAAESPPGLDWELGREENLAGQFDKTHYFANLARKTRRIRAILAQHPEPGRLVYNFEGFKLKNLERLLASEAIREFDILSLHPYRWKTFPSPEEWLPGFLQDVRGLLAKHGLGDKELWITETGIPVRGTTDPDAFYGYPESGAEVPGATRDYAALYLVKLHVLAIAGGVRRVYQYNYQNRGNSPVFAEHHFGLRSYTEQKREPGHPLPAYLACMTMLDELYRERFVEAREPANDVRVFEFAATGADQATLVAWALPGASATLPWSALRAGLAAGAVTGIKDVLGTPVPVSADGIALDERPCWITVRTG